MNLVLFTIVFGLSLPNYATANNRLVYFGGGDSKEAEDTFFDHGFKKVFKYAKDSNWNSDFYYRQSNLENLTAEEKAVLKPPRDFEQKINSLIKEIENHQITNKDKLLVYLDTHGSMDQDMNYSISVDDQKVRSESFERLAAAANKYDIQLGIVGATCYSGSLQQIQSKNICVISASRPDKVGVNLDSFTFSDSLAEKQGHTNLEELYLTSRAKAYSVYNIASAAQPMISTPAGSMTDQILSPLTARIIHKNNETADFNKRICLDSNFGLDKLRLTVQDLLATTKKENHAALKTELMKSLNTVQSKIAVYDQLRNDLSSRLTWNEKLVCPEFSNLKLPCRDVFFIDSIKIRNEEDAKDCAVTKAQSISCITVASLLKYYAPYINSPTYKKFLTFKAAYEKEYPQGIKLQEISEQISIQDEIFMTKSTNTIQRSIQKKQILVAISTSNNRRVFTSY